MKSKACLLEELSLPSQGLNAIIDQETKEVSLIAAGNIEPCTGTYRLSYHATISPDPATTVIDWNASPKLTVTAYDGVSKTVYTVKKEVPAKVPTGIRSGSPVSYTHPINGMSSVARKAGFAARVNYDYANKYLVELSCRYDGSYLFGGRCV